MEQHLEWQDLRLIGVCIAVAVAGLLVGTHFFYQAFPEATIDFAVTRAESAQQAGAFLQDRGLDLSGYRHSAIFSFDDDAKTFLERELGFEGATATIDRPVRLWRWSNRWARELQKEEYRVEHTTRGELVGFTHQVDEAAPGALLDQAAARSLAEGFLAEVSTRPAADLEFVEAETRQRPNRVDHFFTWKLRGFEVRDATYRYRVEVQGDQVGGYSEFLKIPEDWTRDYRQLRSRNEATGLAAGSLLLFTMVAMAAWLVVGIRGHEVRWRTALAFGGIAFALTFLSQLNMLPVAQYSFDTTDTYGSFVSDQLLTALLGGLGYGVLITFIVAAAEPAYRRRYGEQISLTEQFLPDGIRTKRFFLGTIIGLTMTVAFMAYVTVFYLVAGKLGAWMPADIPYREMVNTYIPWVVVLLIGFFPAVSEELMSRAFSIPFFERYLGRRWAAVLVAALIWGFAHASYPQQPFYIRGIEVSIAGVAFGLVMLRWGLLPVLVCHYTIDALWTAMILLRSSNRYYVLSAALSVGIMLLPLAVSLAYYLRHRFFVDPTYLLNREDDTLALRPRQAPEPPDSPEARLVEAAPDEVSPHPPLSRRRLIAAALAVLASMAVFLVDVEKPSPSLPVTVTPVRAEHLAAQHLTALGVDLGAYRTATTHHPNWDASAARYRLERGGPAAVARMAALIPPNRWRVRFYRPLQTEEYQVYVDPADGSVYTTVHLVPEDAAGADLSEAEARSLAEEQLRGRGLDPAGFQLEEYSSEKLKARRDHRLVWQARDQDPRNLDESYFRCTVELAGDQPTAVRRWVKLPEAWLRQREESTLVQSVLRWVLAGAGVLLFLHLAWLFVRAVREGRVAWHRPLRLGAVAAGLAALGFANGLPTLYGDYPTEVTTAVFLVGRVVRLALAMVLGGGSTTLAVALAAGLFPAVGRRLRLAWEWAELRDAALVAVLIWLGGTAMERARLLVIGWLPAHAAVPTPAFVPGADAYLPLLSGLSAAVGAAIYLPVAAALAVHYAVRVLGRASYVVVAVLILGVAAAGSAAHSGGEFYLALAAFLVEAGLAAAVIGLYLRESLLAYMLAGALPAALDAARKLLAQGSTFYQVNGAALAAVAAMGVLALALLTWRDHPRRGRLEPGVR